MEPVLCRSIRAWLIAGCLAALQMSAGWAADQSRPLSAHHVSADGHPLAVWEKSPASPEQVVLLVHGRTWSTRPDFDLQVPGEDLSLMDGLVARGIATYGVDLRGYGDTARDSTGWLTPKRATDDVVHVLKWMAQRHPDTPKPFVFGWSYGAMVAQLAAQMHPDLVSGLIVFGYPWRPEIASNPANLPASPLRKSNTAAGAAADFITPGSISQAAIDAYVAAALEHDPVRVDWRSYPHWHALDPTEVTVPTLLIDAEHDPVTNDDVLRDLFAKLATADKAWVNVPGGDHAAFLEEPRDYFLAVMAAFINGKRVREAVLSADFFELE